MATTAALALDTTMEAAEDAKPVADEFVFDAPAYYDLKNPALERRYVNNADGYFSSPTPSAATSRSSPPTADSFADKAPIEIEKAPLTDPDPVTRSLAGSYESFKSGKEEAEAETRLAAPAYPQSRSTDNQQVEGKLSVSQLDSNAEDAEMTDGASVRGVPLDNQLHHEQDADEVMSDAGSEGTVAMDTTVVMTEAVEPAGLQQAMDVEAAATAILSHSQLTEDRPETFEEVFAQYASSSQSSATSYLMQELDVSKTSSHHYSPHSSFHSSQGSVSPHLRAGRRSPPPPLSDPVSMYSNNNGGYPPAPRSTGSSSGSYRHHRPADDVSSKLMQPTQSYMRRLQAEQRVRDQNYMEDVPVEDKPHRATRPRSPRLRTTQKAQTHQKSPNDISRMSSTSRELLKIQEERLRLQMERLKIREFHEKTKVQRTPTNVFQRSTKQLTIPQSPNLQVDGRTRRVQYGNDTAANGEEAKPSIIEPETLMSRDYTIPTAKPHHSRTSGVPHPTVPHTPQLQTTARATRRGIVPNIHKQQEREQQHRAPSKTSGGITQPATPQLETKRRAQATASYRRPLEVVDKDEEELARKFHARPVNKKMLEPKLQQPSAAMGSGRAPLTKPVAPNLSTGSRPSTRTGTTSAELERKRQEREQQRQMRGKPPQPTRQGPLPPRRPVVPETPPLKSIQLHRQYQEQFQRRVEAEARERAKQHNFKANPVRYTSNPQRFEGSTKPLTEFKPFEMPGEKYHAQARERLESKRREEEEKLAAATAFHATPMPEFTGDADGAGNRGFHVQPSTKPLTSFAAPKLASDRRAAERAAFDAAERERREQDEAYRKRVEEDARRLEEDEIKRLRKEKLVFHARPAPEAKPFLTKPSTKPLTEPMTPVTHFNPQRSQESTHE